MCVLFQLGSSQFVTWQQDRPPRTKEMQIEPCEGKETAWGFGKRSMEKMMYKLNIGKKKTILSERGDMRWCVFHGDVWVCLPSPL